MKVGIFGDVHITKNMRTLQYIWEGSATCSIMQMYNKFDEEGVEFVVCLGDFFDTPKIEAKHLHLLLPVFNIMNTRKYPTFMILGNHEIDDDEHNILEYLSEYENIKPVTDYDIFMREFVFIPYNVDPAGFSPEFIKDMYVFTHHDIYGSELAGGKTKAFFGLDPSIFKEAKRVFNGHVHLKSRISPNIINAGSLLVSQQGELRVGDYPSYYILDEPTGEITEYKNEASMIFLSAHVNDLDHIISTGYDPSRLVLRLDYEGELSVPEKYLETSHMSFRKLISSISSDSSNEIIRTTNFDLKNYLVDHINKDESISPELRQSYIEKGLEILG